MYLSSSWYIVMYVYIFIPLSKYIKMMSWKIMSIKSWSVWKDLRIRVFLTSRSSRLDFDLDFLRHECGKEHFVHLFWEMTWLRLVHTELWQRATKMPNAFVQSLPTLRRIRVPHTAHTQERYLNRRVDSITLQCHIQHKPQHILGHGSDADEQHPALLPKLPRLAWGP